MKSIYIAQGEEAVSGDEGVLISTVLGSCIAICLWDPVSHVGGMNHLLLPELSNGVGKVDTVGAIAMERLVNQMVHAGAERKRLRAKVFGGASMLGGRTDIGARNAAFSQAYLSHEGIVCDAESTGGQSARRVQFFPFSGAARQRFVKDAPVLKAVHLPQSNDIELF